MVARACIMVDFAFCGLEFRVRACCNKTQILASKAFVDTGITEPDFQQGRTSSSTARLSLLLWLLLPPSRTGTDVSLVSLRLILPCPADCQDLVELRGPSPFSQVAAALKATVSLMLLQLLRKHLDGWSHMTF